MLGLHHAQLKKKKYIRDSAVPRKDTAFNKHSYPQPQQEIIVYDDGIYFIKVGVKNLYANNIDRRKNKIKKAN